VNDAPKVLVVGVTGASGALYAVRLLKAGLDAGLQLHLVASDYGKRLLIEECGLNLKTQSVESWLDEAYGKARRDGTLTLHSVHDLGATLASGSVHWDGMAIVPCSMKTLSGVAHGASTNLIERAADVTLKEARPLVLVPRETPLNRIQLENMSRAAGAGAQLCPAMPAFYTRPKSFEDLADFIAGRVLSLLGVRHPLVEPWAG
jgi:4-hydroxy-3-polyprenylbenzoate decarboxylase